MVGALLLPGVDAAHGGCNEALKYIAIGGARRALAENRNTYPLKRKKG